MAGKIKWQEQAIVTLTSTGASLANAANGAAGTNLDCRSGGNAADMFAAIFTLNVQWATITGITNGVNVADLYLLPAPDGTNFPDIVSGANGVISANHYVGSFIDAKAPTANVNMLFASPTVLLLPLLYTAYINNQSGQTMSVNWTLSVVTTQGQYT